jgi:hypothetical protein
MILNFKFDRKSLYEIPTISFSLQQSATWNSCQVLMYAKLATVLTLLYILFFSTFSYLQDKYTCLSPFYSWLLPLHKSGSFPHCHIHWEIFFSLSSNPIIQLFSFYKCIFFITHVTHLQHTHTHTHTHTHYLGHSFSTSHEGISWKKAEHKCVLSNKCLQSCN